jgi:hypothetical protein
MSSATSATKAMRPARAANRAMGEPSPDSGRALVLISPLAAGLKASQDRRLLPSQYGIGSKPLRRSCTYGPTARRRLFLFDWGLGTDYSIPSGPWASPERNCLTNWLSELKSSDAGPDSTILPFHRTAMKSATRRADMMSWVITQ